MIAIIGLTHTKRNDCEKNITNFINWLRKKITILTNDQEKILTSLKVAETNCKSCQLVMGKYCKVCETDVEKISLSIDLKKKNYIYMYANFVKEDLIIIKENILILPNDPVR